MCVGGAADGSALRNMEEQHHALLTLNISVISTKFKLAGMQARRMQCNREHRAENQKRVCINHWWSLGLLLPSSPLK